MVVLKIWFSGCVLQWSSKTYLKTWFCACIGDLSISFSLEFWLIQLPWTNCFDHLSKKPPPHPSYPPTHKMCHTSPSLPPLYKIPHTSPFILSSLRTKYLTPHPSSSLFTYKMKYSHSSCSFPHLKLDQEDSNCLQTWQTHYIFHHDQNDQHSSVYKMTIFIITNRSLERFVFGM